MYLDHFGLNEAPFSIAPDPRYLFLSTAHREALGHLIYGLRGAGGFVLLTGEVGTGKTTVCRCLLEQVPENVQVGLILNPSLTVTELLATICDEFGVAYPSENCSNKVFIDALNRFLLESHSRGKTSTLLIDEAQNLSGEVLEQLRLLTNLETSSRKLLQIVLIGQPELRDLLAQPRLRQIAQRITARYHLGSLQRDDLEQYIRHRLAVAGRRRPIFSRQALDLIYRFSKGIPRLVNVIADRALLGAYVLGKERVGPRLVKRAVREVLDTAPQRRLSGWFAASLVTALGLAGAVLIGSVGLDGEFFEPAAVAVPAMEPATPEHAPEPAPWPAAPGPPQAAARALLAAWGAHPPTVDDLCAAAEAAGLQCLSDVGTLDMLRRLNRPVVLELETSRGEAFRGTLMATGDGLVELIAGDGLRTYTLEDLQRHWLGRFTLLWRPVPEFEGTLSRGARGQAVAWLAGALRRAGGPEAVDFEERSHFDAAMEAVVRQFQLRHGLLPDGIAGPQTLILLNQSLDVPGPRLAALDLED